MPWTLELLPSWRLRLAAGAVLLGSLLAACGPGSDAGTDLLAQPPDDPVTPARQARVLALGRAGEMASLDIAAPWAVRARGELGRTIGSARCRAGVCAVTHPAPASALSLVDAATLRLVHRIELPADSDPRDVVFTGDTTVVVSLAQRDHLLEIDTGTLAQRRIALAALADADGLPESGMLAACGRQVYVQLQRLDRQTGLPGTLPPAIAVVDTWDGDRLGVIALALPPALDLQVDCSARTLLVAEPQPVIQGLGRVEQVNLRDGSVHNVLKAEEFANGGMLRLRDDLYWLNQHTDFGPGPSSHLSLVGGRMEAVYNVFAREPVDNLAYDAATGLLFYPNPCASLGEPCDGGVHVFDALSGDSAAARSIDPGFAPVEVVVSR